MIKAIIIGGSAGSFQVVNKILASLPKNYPYSVFLCLHRLKHVRTGFVEALSLKSGIPIMEPFDKDLIKPGIAYLAPANYHMYIDYTGRISLSTEEPVHHSRPSIDLCFFTAAQTYRNKLVGIILSGANKDGAAGLKMVSDLGGITIIQDPSEAEVPVMPKAAMDIMKVNHVMRTEEIIKYLNHLNNI